MPHRRHRCLLIGWLASVSRVAWLAAVTAAYQDVQAQPTPAPTVPADDARARAERDADKVFQWIRIHSDKRRKTAAHAQASAPVGRAATRPATPVDTGIRETAVPLPASAAAPAQAVAVAPARDGPVQAPEPATPVATAPVIEDETLTPVRRTEPQFPASLVRTLRKGVVQVAFTVQPDGSVAQAHVVSASHPRLGPPAVETVTQWRFQPVRHAQQAVVDLGFDID
jgi:protein TonB